MLRHTPPLIRVAMLLITADMLLPCRYTLYADAILIYAMLPALITPLPLPMPCYASER